MSAGCLLAPLIIAFRLAGAWVLFYGLPGFSDVGRALLTIIIGFVALIMVALEVRSR